MGPWRELLAAGWGLPLGWPTSERELVIAAVGAAVLVLLMLPLWLLGSRRRQSAESAAKIRVLEQRVADLAAGGLGPRAGDAGRNLLPPSMPVVAVAQAQLRRPLRIMLFIDCPNLEVTFRRRAVALKNSSPALDWRLLPRLMMAEIARLGLWDAAELRFIGAQVYDSYIPPDVLRDLGVSDADAQTQYRLKFRTFLLETLAEVPGYSVNIFDRVVHRDKAGDWERDKKGLFKGVEKGVDTSIVADMILGAASGIFDAAVLVSDDNDYLPAVTALQNRFGVPVIHAGFRPPEFGKRRALQRTTFAHIRFTDALVQQLVVDKSILSRFREAFAWSPQEGAASAEADGAVQLAEKVPALAATPLKATFVSSGAIYEARVDMRFTFGLRINVAMPDGIKEGFVHHSLIELPSGVVLSAAFVVGQAVRVRDHPPDDKGRRQFTMLGVPQPKLGVVAATVPPAPPVTQPA